MPRCFNKVCKAIISKSAVNASICIVLSNTKSPNLNTRIYGISTNYYFAIGFNKDLFYSRKSASNPNFASILNFSFLGLSSPSIANI